MDNTTNQSGKKYVPKIKKTAIESLSMEQWGKLVLQIDRGDSRTNLKKFLFAWTGESSASLLDDALKALKDHPRLKDIYDASDKINREETHSLKLFGRQGTFRRCADVPWLFSYSESQDADYVTHTSYPRCIAKVDGGEIESIWFIDNDASDAVKGTMPHRIAIAFERYIENDCTDEVAVAMDAVDRAEEDEDTENVEPVKIERPKVSAGYNQQFPTPTTTPASNTNSLALATVPTSGNLPPHEQQGDSYGNWVNHYA